MSPSELAALKQRLQNDPEKQYMIEIVEQYYAPVGKKSLLSWDLVRYIALCRWGYVAGYLSEDEAWQRIMPIARKLQKNYHSWKRVGDNYIIGRKFWSYTQTMKNGDEYINALNYLCADKSSPWRTLPWKMDLGK